MVIRDHYILFPRGPRLWLDIKMKGFVWYPNLHQIEPLYQDPSGSKAIKLAFTKARATKVFIRVIFLTQVSVSLRSALRIVVDPETGTKRGSPPHNIHKHDRNNLMFQNIYIYTYKYVLFIHVCIYILILLISIHWFHPWKMGKLGSPFHVVGVGEDLMMAIEGDASRGASHTFTMDHL